MNVTDSNLRSHQMDDEALRWATRLDGGVLSPAEQAALGRWLAADPARQWRLAHFQRFYAQLHGTLPAMEAEGLVGTGVLPAAPGRSAKARGWLAAGLVAASVVLGALWFAQRPVAVATHMAQRTSMRLADGSQVELNARSRLAVRISGEERHVRLEAGEAFFAVAKEAGRVFLVETPGGTVRVTGTRFNVRTGDDGALRVTVLEGSVAVKPGRDENPAGEIALVRFDQLTVGDGSAGLRRLSDTAAEDAVAWREGKAVFNDTPLGEALQAFAGYHDLRVNLAPEAVALRLGGRFTLDDFDQFLDSLEDALPVRVLRAEGKVRIVAR